MGCPAQGAHVPADVMQGLSGGLELCAQCDGQCGREWRAELRGSQWTPELCPRGMEKWEWEVVGW